jgi:HSP20 family protein
MKKEIIPSSWRDSLGELREEVSQTINRWLRRLRPEERREAEAELERGNFPVFGGGLYSLDWAAPRVDMKEDTNHIYVSVEVPGMKKDDLKVDLDDRVLTIHGEKESQREQQRGHARYFERSFGAFSRSILLPCKVEPGKIEAKCRDGMLRMTLPKTEAAKAHRITVSNE